VAEFTKPSTQLSKNNPSGHFMSTKQLLVFVYHQKRKQKEKLCTLPDEFEIGCSRTTSIWNAMMRGMELLIEYKILLSLVCFVTPPTYLGHIDEAFGSLCLKSKREKRWILCDPSSAQPRPVMYSKCR